MSQKLHLGLFNFKNDEVLLIAGDAAAVVALARRLRTQFDSGKTCVAIHDVASVSKRHPALLFAVRGGYRQPNQNAFVWQCSETDIEKIIAAGSRTGELHFELTKTPPYFYVNFSGHYDEEWWATHG